MGKGKAKAIPVQRVVPIVMPIKLHDSLRYLTTIKDSSGKKHSIDEIVVGACNLYLLSLQTSADMKNKKKETKKMN